MNIIELAKEAGLQLNVYAEAYPVIAQQLERFAALVRAEREWVDLTCEEVTALIREGAADGGWQGFATRVQDAFKEKNK
jgi:hypothetical protein